MKKVLLMLVAVVMMLSVLAACGSTEPTPSASGSVAPPVASDSTPVETESTPPVETPAEDFFVGLSFNGLDVVPAMQKDMLEAKFNELGWKYVTVSGDLDANKQVADIENLVLQDPDVILVRANSFARSTIYKIIAEAGIPLLAMGQGSTTGLTDEEAEWLTAGIGESDMVRGCLLGNWLADYMEANPTFVPKIGFLVGDAGSDAKLVCQRTYDFMRTMQARGFEEGKDWFYVTRGAADPLWSTAGAMKVTEDWLQRYSIDELNMVYCWSDEMVVGVCQAMIANNKTPGDYMITSFDGLEIINQYMKDGWISAVSSYNFTKQVDKMIEVLQKVKDGKVGELQKIEFANSMFLMTQDNYEKYLAGDDSDIEYFQYTGDMEINPVLTGSDYFPE